MDQSLHPRLDKILSDLRNSGFNVIEGKCLRENTGYVSADAKTRTAEFMDFLTAPEVDAVIPPYGGELATECLPLLDYEKLRQLPPKWIVGYSDISTITCAITVSCDYATVHGPCLMEMLANQNDPLTSGTLQRLFTEEMGSFSQKSSPVYQDYFQNWQENPLTGFDLRRPTQWRSLNKQQDQQAPETMRGRLFGGCLDTLVNLFANPYLDFEQFKQRYQLDGVLLYLENVEQSPIGLKRALLSMQYRGVFDNLNGILLGRSTGPEDAQGQLDYYQVIEEFFAERDYPVFYDVDISHYPPNMTIVNGALASVQLQAGKGVIKQTLVP
ncbi:LD-carboxypeptidase [Planctobacterium marinum]|uniref:LD-carboxypeptidase n=1 Tax=Planctobacterium marinum TaxID=1631968 RepID=A0AA48HK78_9ALTE|nr:LD-carboxypeptidase [Planctobacterium marinum]